MVKLVDYMAGSDKAIPMIERGVDGCRCLVSYPDIKDFSEKTIHLTRCEKHPWVEISGRLDPNKEMPVSKPFKSHLDSCFDCKIQWWDSIDHVHLDLCKIHQPKRKY